MIADARKSTSCYFLFIVTVVSLNKPLAYGNGFVISFKMRNTGIWLFYDGGFDMHQSGASMSPRNHVFK